MVATVAKTTKRVIGSGFRRKILQRLLQQMRCKTPYQNSYDGLLLRIFADMNTYLVRKTVAGKMKKKQVVFKKKSSNRVRKPGEIGFEDTTHSDENF